MKKINLTQLVLLSSIVSFAGCNPKKEASKIFDDAALASTAQLVGTARSACLPAPTILGSAYVNKSVEYSLTIQANENITMDVSFYDSPNCAGGTAAYNFTQFGTIAYDSLSMSVLGGGNFNITLGNKRLSVSSSTSHYTTWKNLFNTQCSPANSFASDGSINVASVSCTGGGLNAIAWTASGVTKNVFTLSGSTLKMYRDPSDTYGQYKLGISSGFPNSVNLSLSF
jgi:hypothetical protein